jgi:lycopene cyclase domain-containing protein
MTDRNPVLPWHSWLIGLSALLTIALLWTGTSVVPDQFLMAVPALRHLPQLETPFLYALLLGFTLFFPLVRSFEPRLAYFRKWRYLWPGNLAIGLVFIAWDAWFTRVGVWGFNDTYLTGARLWGLPWEEWMFFAIVPFSCVFIFEAHNYYVRREWPAWLTRALTATLAMVFLVVGIAYWQHLYTATTFLLCFFFQLFLLLFPRNLPIGRFYAAYLLSLLPFLLVNGALTGAFTEEPVVFYNPDEYLGIRILTIPLDDAVYGYLLLMSNYYWYAWRKTNQR